MAAPGPPSSRPWRNARFEPIAVIGRGTSGVVYRVLDRETGDEVALKTLHAQDPEAVYRLKSEFRACAGIRHRNLVGLYELHASDGECFFTMELVQGTEFVRYVRNGAPPDDPAALVRFIAAARELVDGLAAVHAAGKLHRDIKPANALVEPDGRVVLLDFGFMIPFGPRVLAIEQSDTVAGSLAYMAPEVLWGEPVSPASDWYSVGVVFYEALSGRLPFEGSPAQLIARENSPPLPLLPAVPAALRDLVTTLLAREPERRPDAEEIARTLDRCSVEQRANRNATPSPLAHELPFVGRQPELEQLGEALARVRQGLPCIVQIRGPSGIGKTELVRQFLAMAEQRDEAIVALGGRCHPYEAVPYRAWDGLVDSLSHHLGGLSESAAAALVPRYARAMTRLFPVLGRVPLLDGAHHEPEAELEAQELRRRGAAALRELLARIGDRRRLLLWIDDIQWADPDSLLLARELFGGADPPLVLLLLTYRSDDRGAAETFANFDDRSGERSSMERLTIDLDPLSDRDAHELAERFAAGGLTDVSTAVREAAGSPFFLGQLVRHLVAAAESGTSDVSTALSDVLRTRLDQLATPTRSLLEIIAVAGRAIEPRLALTATSLLSTARRELIGLQQERLLRLTAGGRPAVEVYHDRIREAVVAGLTPAALQERHRALAHVLVNEPNRDAQALYRHFLGAHEHAPAADWATVAAERADSALAFTEAADLYDAAAKLRGDADDRYWPLQRQRGTALVNAGRGAEAAPLFLSSASHTLEADALDLRRMAAEQYMQTGHIAEGVTVLQALLRELDLDYPKSTARAALATGARLLAIATRGARPYRPTRSPVPHAVLRIESARSAAKGLAMVDPFRALYFAVTALGLALRTDDQHRIARELAGVGVTLLPAGGPTAGWASRLIDRARTMAQSLDDPYLLGFTSITLAQQSMLAARWREMLERCDEGVALLRDHCRGISWEVSIGSGAAERALEELGEISTMAARVESALQQAEDADDMYRAISALENIALVRIAQNRLADARQAIARARLRATSEAFHMQHFYMLRAEAYCDLGEGRIVDAWRGVDDMWPEIERSNLLRHALIRTDAYLLRARTRLARAKAEPGERGALLRLVERDAKVLAGQRRIDAVAHGQLVLAAVATQQSAAPRAVALLNEALTLFERGEMQLSHALVRLRLASLLPGERAEEMRRSAESAMTALGVASPSILAEIYAPGFG